MGKKRSVWLLVAAGVTAGLAFFAPDPGSRGTSTSALDKARPERAADAGEGRFAALPKREAFGAAQGKPFGEPPPPMVAAPAARTAPAKPVPPPMPYRVAGQLVRDGAAHVVLSAGDRVYTVQAGEKLDNGFMVESINAEGVTILYEPLKVRQVLPFTSALGIDAPFATAALAPPSPPRAEESGAIQVAQGGATEPHGAHLRWEGPAKVKAGDAFNVVLRLTSEQPVRALPLQLSYDAKLLQPLGVKPGDFFAGGSFNYRINPGGSIFVGALSPGAPADDAEFMVLTFKPIRAGATAELGISSMVLHGAAGGTIALDRPASFRTAIQQ